MKHRLFTLVIAVAVIVSLVLVGCAKPAPTPTPEPTPSPTPTPSPPAGPEEILVGTVTMLTGMYAAIGTGAAWGVRAAVDDINKQGGIYVKEYDRKLPVKLIVLDDESDPMKSATLTEDLILRENINFFIKAHAPPEMVSPTATACDRHGIPNLAGGCPLEPTMEMRGNVESHWPYTWVVGLAFATPASEGDFRYGKPGYTFVDAYKAGLDQVADKTNKVIALFATEDTDGIAFYGLFSDVLTGWGFDIVGLEERVGMFPMDTTDFSSIIGHWKQDDAEIMVGMSPGPVMGTLLRQCRSLGFNPKVVISAKAAVFRQDVVAWGGDLPNGVCAEENWVPTYSDSPGIGSTTPQSLFDRWVEDTGESLYQSIGWSYACGQVLFDAIERAGTLDPDAVNKALGETDMMTITHRVKFEKETQCSRVPLALTQWQKIEGPEEWWSPVVASYHDFIPVESPLLFPIPYD